MSFYTTKLVKAELFVKELENYGAINSYENLGNGSWDIKVNGQLELVVSPGIHVYNEVIKLDYIEIEDFSEIAKRYMKSMFLEKGQYICVHGRDTASKIISVDNSGWGKIDDPFHSHYNPSYISNPTTEQILKYAVKCLSTLPKKKNASPLSPN